jgi:hypothetical protein
MDSGLHGRLSQTFDLAVSQSRLDRNLILGDGRLLPREIRYAVFDAVRRVPFPRWRRAIRQAEGEDSLAQAGSTLSFRHASWFRYLVRRHPFPLCDHGCTHGLLPILAAEDTHDCRHLSLCVHRTQGTAACCLAICATRCEGSDGAECGSHRRTKGQGRL